MSAAEPPGDVTGLLRRVEAGDPEASSRLAELVHADLRRLAAKFLAGERAAHTLQPTALANEAWIRLLPQTSRSLQGRGHFMAIAARVMRQILVDHARARGRQRRGGEWQRVSFSEAVPGPRLEAALDEMLDLDNALEKLAGEHPRPARVVELRAFGGLTIAETARVLGVSDVTVEDDWVLAKAWLARALTSR